MRRSLPGLLLLLFALVLSAEPSNAKIGLVRVTFAKAGVVAGAGAGRGVLTFDGREYPFIVYGLSLGITVGASITHLSGRAANLHHLSDFEGTYTAAGTGGALVIGGRGVSLTNDRGVIIWLHGPAVGLEFASNVSGVRIELKR